MRHSNRQKNQLREIELIPGFNPYAEGSCLVKFGGTHVICTASVEEKVPAWLKGQNKGWITAEELSKLADKYMKTDYGKYLKDVAEDKFVEE